MQFVTPVVSPPVHLDGLCAHVCNHNPRGLNVDLVVAADVVYDRSIIPDLVAMLCELLSGEAPPEAVFASTVRNPETLLAFEQALLAKGMVLEGRVSVPPEADGARYLYARTAPVELWHVRRGCE